MPNGGYVDRNDRLAKLSFQGRKKIEGGQIGTRLHDRIDILAIELVDDHVDHLARRRMCDRSCSVAFQTNHVGNAIAGFFEKTMYLMVSDRLIRGQGCN